MPTIQRHALLPHSAQQVYQLVNAVADYPAFMDGCVGAEVLDHSADYMEAKLHLAKAGLAYSFTTRNRLVPFESIEMTLVEGPFEQLLGAWRFQALAPGACKVMLELQFTLSSSVASLAAGKLLTAVGNNLVTSLCARAKQIYG